MPGRNARGSRLSDGFRFRMMDAGHMMERYEGVSVPTDFHAFDQQAR
jgi:hypothetical protein